MPANHLLLCCPLLHLPSIFPSIRVFWLFTSGGQSIGTFSINPSNEYSGLISFRTEEFDLLAVQGTLKNLLQHHNSKASILWCSAFYMVSHPYMITVKTIALTVRTFVGQEISLIFNTLSRSVIAFLPRSKYLLISWRPSPSAVILEPEKMKSVTVSTFSLSICHEVMGPDAMNNTLLLRDQICSQNPDRIQLLTAAPLLPGPCCGHGASGHLSAAPPPASVVTPFKKLVLCLY